MSILDIPSFVMFGPYKPKRKPKGPTIVEPARQLEMDEDTNQIFSHEGDWFFIIDDDDQDGSTGSIGPFRSIYAAEVARALHLHGEAFAKPYK